VLREIREETGLPEQKVQLASNGEPIIVPAEALGILWIVHPYLFDIEDSENIRLDWEHKEMQWVNIAELNNHQLKAGGLV